MTREFYIQLDAYNHKSSLNNVNDIGTQEKISRLQDSASIFTPQPDK